MPSPLPPKNSRPPGARRKSGRRRPSEAADSDPNRKSEGSKADPQEVPVISGYATGFDGTKLFYSREGQGRPLVFCYGLVCSSLHWTYQIEHFRKSYQAIWMDYRGHCNSETPRNLDSLTLDNCASDLKVVLDELGVKDAVFLGHSMGVNVVLEFCRQYPERVSGMVLANGTAQRPLETLFSGNWMQAGFSMLSKIHRHQPKLVEKIWRWQKRNPLTRSLVTLGGFNPHLTPREDIELYIDQVTDMDPAILLQLVANYEAYDATSWLHTIRAPTLLIAGEHDRMVPVERQELMRQLIPNSRLEVIRHGSHCPQMDLPDLVNLKIERFLEDINYADSRSTPTKGSASQSTARPPSLDPRAPA